MNSYIFSTRFRKTVVSIAPGNYSPCVTVTTTVPVLGIKWSRNYERLPGLGWCDVGRGCQVLSARTYAALDKALTLAQALDAEEQRRRFARAYTPQEFATAA